jgi:Flp pilus assembly protein TadD
MTRFCIAITALFTFLAVSHLGSQTNPSASPQDTYLQIYLTIQEADRMESGGQKASARGKYQQSLDDLKALQQSNPDWEKTIVNYRIKYCQEKIDSLASAVDASTDEDATAPAPTAVPAATGDQGAAPAPASGDKSNAAVMEEKAPVESASGERLPVVAPVPVIQTTTTSEDTSAETAALKKRIKDLEEELSDTKEKLASAVAESAELRAQIASLQTQLDGARKASGDEKINQLVEENTALKQKLADADAQIATLKNSGDPSSVANLQEQVKKIKDQLTMSQQENEALNKANEDYRNKLVALQKELEIQSSRLTELSGPNNPLAKENEMLRGIVDRALKEQARRDAAKRLALEEMNTMNVQSETLKTQLTILGSPVVELTDEEKAMLKSPTATVTVDPAGNISAPLPGGSAASYDTRARVPDEFRDVAADAQRLFAQRKFDEAAAKYQIILNTYPDSLYALSNLGVVRFQQQNYPEAEKVLKKAVEIAPDDAFSHSILGIVLYQQGKYDEAMTILTRAVALDPKDPKSLNYLGICASQKGLQEAAEQACRKAIELDETYGDAHFNLAVIYATQKPPAKELARRHYRRALELGVPRDDSLEEMMK